MSERFQKKLLIGIRRIFSATILFTKNKYHLSLLMTKI